MKLHKMIPFVNCAIASWCLPAQAEVSLDNLPTITNSFLMSLEKKHDEKTTLKYGTIHGQLYIPQGIDPASIVVQVGAIRDFNQTSEDFYTTPDANGRFSFDNTFSVGSSLNLVIWDRNGQLNKRVFPVYVSKIPGTYHIYLQKSSYTAALSSSYGSTQDFTKSGVCGHMSGLTKEEIIGAHVTVSDMSGKNNYPANYFDKNGYPNIAQRSLAKNGSFCVFNIDNNDNSFQYYVHLQLQNGGYKTFSVYLPPYTFADNIEFDARAALFRPMKIFAWDNLNNSLFKIASTRDSFDWKPVYNSSISTSVDYSSIQLTDNKSNEPIYFPLNDEFLNINYSFDPTEENHFFVYQPRSALFTRDILKSIKTFEPGRAYIAKDDPFVLKVFDPRTIIGDNIRLLTPLYNNNFGSLYVNIDSSDFRFDKKYLKLSLKDISGADVSNFYPMTNGVGKEELSGFFYNIPIGIYQLFLTVQSDKSHCDNCTTINKNEKLLWSSLVESIANKTQVLTNISDAKILIESQFEQPAKPEANVVNENTIENSQDKVASQKPKHIVHVASLDASYDDKVDDLLDSPNTESVDYVVDGDDATDNQAANKIPVHIVSIDSRFDKDFEKLTQNVASAPLIHVIHRDKGLNKPEVSDASNRKVAHGLNDIHLSSNWGYTSRRSTFIADLKYNQSSSEIRAIATLFSSRINP